MLILGRYELREMAGQGGTGKVYRAFDRHLQRTVAVKQTAVDEQDGNKGRCLWNEAKLLNSMEHHALPKVYDYFKEEETVYMVTEFIRGATLEEYITSNGPMGKQLALTVMQELISVFFYLHSFQPPIIYCDLKPANIMIREDGRIKLIDFGAAAAVRNKAQAGTPGYSAPELLTVDSKPPDLSESNDIYSLGAVFHFLLTGNTFASMKESRHNLPFSTKKIIIKCLHENPYRRYANVGQLKKALNYCESLKRPSILKAKSFRTAYFLLLSASITILLLSSSTSPGSVNEHSPESVNELPVTVRDSDGYKLLIKEGAVYRPVKDIILELPLSGIPKGEEVILQIVIYDQKSRYESRKFLICNSNN